MQHISKKQARRLALDAQFHFDKTSNRDTKTQIVSIIRQLSYLQIDSIAVINRAHHHTLWTRNAKYEKDMLWELLGEDKMVFEYWSHAAAFLPIEDYRFSLPRKQDFVSGKRHWFPKDKKVRQYVYDRIKAEGALMARDFKSEVKTQPWWGWKPAKIALEQLFQEGKLMVLKRHNFQKVYDLTERVLPANIDTKYPDNGEMMEHLIGSFLKAHHTGTAKQFTYQRSSRYKKGIQNKLMEMVEAGILRELKIEDIPRPYYSFSSLLDNKVKTVSKRNIRLLGPFDNLIIQRQRLSELFDYNYVLECYVPQAKRRFGYYSLAILWGDEIMGILDPKADKKNNTFFIQNIYLQKEPKDYDKFAVLLIKQIKALAKFNGCELIRLKNCNDKVLEGKLKFL